MNTNPKPTYTAKQQGFIDARVLQIKRELLRSWWGMDPIESSHGNALPITVDRFSLLHDYCDANTLGGMCDDGVFDLVEKRLFRGESVVTVLNVIQTIVDEWLKARNSVTDYALIVRCMDFEQVDCLLDDERVAEAYGMLDDLEARVGFSAEMCDAFRALLPPNPEGEQ